jgi:hypothetical protein
MHTNIFAYTAPGSNYPEFVSLNQQADGSITLSVRGPAIVAACGPQAEVTLPRRELLNLFDALRRELTPPMMAARGESI